MAGDADVRQDQVSYNATFADRAKQSSRARPLLSCEGGGEATEGVAPAIEGAHKLRSPDLHWANDRGRGCRRDQRCLKDPAVSCVIPGCKSAEQVQKNAAAVELVG